MVARGAGAARPVLLACRQWDPLGLARRLPSLGVGAWRSAPLLPWRVQCPVCVCAALAAGFWGFGPVPGVVSLPFPPSCPAFPALCVAGRPVRVSLTLARWYAIPRRLCVPRAGSGCPSGSPRVPFACVCARAPTASAPPPLGGVACAPCAVPALSSGRAVPRGPCPSACPAPFLCSVWRAWGGAVWSRFPPTWLGVVGVVGGRPLGGCLPLLRGASGVRPSPSADCPPTWRAVGVRYQRAVRAGVRVWGPYSVPLACTPCGACVPRGGSAAFVCRGRAWGGGGRAPCPPFARPGGACRAGGRSASFRPSAFPGQATKRLSLASFCPWGAWPPIPLRFVLARLHWARSVPRPGALARARLLSAVPVGAGGWGGGAGRAPAPLSGPGRGDHPPCLGGWRLGPPRLAGWWGGWGGGGSRRGRPAPPLGGSPRYPIPLPSGVRVPSGSRANPGVGGDEGRPVDRSPGAPCIPKPPLLPSLSGLWSWESHGGRGLHTVLVRRRAPPQSLVRALLRRAGVGLPVGRYPRGSRRLGALGRAVCRSSRIPPSASRSLLGEGGRPLGSRGAEGRSCCSQAGGGKRGGGVGGPPPAPPPRRTSACHPLSPACPPGVYSCRGGCRAAAGVGRGPVGRHRVSAVGGGGGEEGGTPLPWFAPPSSPGRPLKGPLRLRRPGRRRSAVGRQRAGRAGACLGPGAPAPRVQRPLRGGCGAAVSSVCLCPLLGLRGRGGGELGGAFGPLAPPPDGRGGGGMAVPAPGASHRLGGRTLPPSPST